MKYVGYPKGLRITREEIRDGIAGGGESEYEAWLIVTVKNGGYPIGECKLRLPDKEGISETDVKLSPEFWGRGYGSEIKQGLVDYLFSHTDCRAVKGTPNRDNIASQKMQKAVGGRRVGEGIFEFPEEKKDYTCPVPHYVYLVFREDWERRKT